MSGADPAPDEAELESQDSDGSRSALEPEQEPAWKRRKRLAELFGDELPEVSGDERAREGGDRGGTPDEWFRSQVPPHHG